jgi:xanthine dehydrogenase accessory factor
MSHCFDENDVLETAAAWLEAGHGVALCTVISTAGSAPRQGGSHIAVRDDGTFAGSVSAGCVEGAVIEEAFAAMREGRHRRLKFGVTDDGSFAVGLMCGGEVEILIEPIA